MKPLSLLFILLLVTVTNRSMAQTDAAKQTQALTYQIIDSQNNTFGYDVYRDGKLMIHQTSIPAMPGNDGFKTRDDAAKVAEMVMYKIRKGEMPPTVTVEEMKELGVIK
ncbi:MAG: DUF4907 domain-containing protein [Chitinophagales bacterium]|nr:DUF4907 domain-containing protein [Chitinophagales bacterium]